MGNTAGICIYIDPCKAICDKKQILFNDGEWDDPIILYNSQRKQATNNTNKRFNKKQNENLYNSSMNDAELMNKNKNRNSLFNSNINTNIYIYSTTQNSKINNSNNNLNSFEKKRII